MLVDYAPQDGPDGLICDKEGNLYVAVRDETRPGIYVYSPDGQGAGLHQDGDPDQRRLRPRRRSQDAVHHGGQEPVSHSPEREGYQLPISK